MPNAFALDLRVRRRKSGLSQEDCAHLLATQHSKISRIENGQLVPNAIDIALLSLIHGKSYDVLCRSVFEQGAKDLRARLNTLPMPADSWMSRFNRTNTLANLEARLEAFINVTYRV